MEPLDRNKPYGVCPKCGPVNLVDSKLMRDTLVCDQCESYVCDNLNTIDRKLEVECLKAFDEGNSKPLQEVIDELKADIQITDEEFLKKKIEILNFLNEICNDRNWYGWKWSGKRSLFEWAGSILGITKNEWNIIHD